MCGLAGVFLIADITVNDPHTARPALAVADVKAFTDRAPVRLAAPFEFAAGLSGFNRPVPDASSHRCPCPTLSNIRVRTATSMQERKGTESLVHQHSGARWRTA